MTAAGDLDAKLVDIAVLVFPGGTGGQLGIVDYAAVPATGIQVGEEFFIAGYGASEADGSGGGTLRIGKNRVEAIEGGGIIFLGVANHADATNAEDVSSGSGDSGGPMLNMAGDLVGVTTSGGEAQQGQRISLYVSTTDQAARTLFRRAVNCGSSNCAKNFTGSGVSDDEIGDGGGGGGVGGNATQLCGQASPATRVCINAEGTIVTITSVMVNIQRQYVVQHSAPSVLMPGATSFNGVANMAHVQGMTAQQQVAFIVHPNGRGKLVYHNGLGWLTFGGVVDFPLEAGD